MIIRNLTCQPVLLLSGLGNLRLNLYSPTLAYGSSLHEPSCFAISAINQIA